MRNHVFLVAVNIATPDGATRKQAERAMMQMLPEPGDTVGFTMSTEKANDVGVAKVEEWWIAEDDRADGSDNDSAVWVHPGLQSKAFGILSELGYTGLHNTPDWSYMPNVKPVRRESIFEALSDEDLEAAAQINQSLHRD